jgi:hypothetical protein
MSDVQEQVEETPEQKTEVTLISLAEKVERAMIKGDLSRLSSEEALAYYKKVCDSVGLNYWTRPFEYIRMPNGKVILYAGRNCTDQLRQKYSVSCIVKERKVEDDILTVHVQASDNTGRKDEDFGSVPFPQTLKGEGRSNAIMKAVTKAKRRVTLSICGLSFTDETEVDSIPGAQRLNPDMTAEVEYRG